MSGTVQTHQLPDLLKFEDELTDNPDKPGEAMKTGRLIARVGLTKAHVVPYSADTVIIKRADLLALVKVAGVTGWALKCGHVQSLLAQIPKEIGS